MIALSGSDVFFSETNKVSSHVSLMYDSCFLGVGCKSESINLEILSVSPSFPETIGLPAKFVLWILVSV